MLYLIYIILLGMISEVQWMQRKADLSCIPSNKMNAGFCTPQEDNNSTLILTLRKNISFNVRNGYFRLGCKETLCNNYLCWGLNLSMV